MSDILLKYHLLWQETFAGTYNYRFTALITSTNFLVTAQNILQTLSLCDKGFNISYYRQYHSNLSLNISNLEYAFIFFHDNCYLRVNKACQERLECQEKEVLENLVLRYVINRGIYLFIFICDLCFLSILSVGT